MATESPGATIHGSAYPMISAKFSLFSISAVAIIEVVGTGSPDHPMIKSRCMLVERTYAVWHTEDFMCLMNVSSVK